MCVCVFCSMWRRRVPAVPGVAGESGGAGGGQRGAALHHRQPARQSAVDQGWIRSGSACTPLPSVDLIDHVVISVIVFSSWIHDSSQNHDFLHLFNTVLSARQRKCCYID